MDPVDLIKYYYDPDAMVYGILIRHGEAVAKLALDIAGRLYHENPDHDFIYEAAMLHDIGIFMTDTPEIGCTGKHPYVCHGYLGREVLEKLGFPKHGLVCERHVGVGIRLEDISRHNLPLPHRDMLPISIEEQIICYADKFFSKNGDSRIVKRSIHDIEKNLERYGRDKVERFLAWHELFG
jgi:uncharacterized protein